MSFPRSASPRRVVQLSGSALAVAVLTMGVGVGACSGKSSGSGAAPAQDPGIAEGGLSAGQASDTNPDGVPYPTDHLGITPRAEPKNPPGDRIHNFKFLGYKNGDKSGGLQPVSLADYYDPTGKNYKIIHISVAGIWCYWCKQEVAALIPIIDELKSKKVVYLTALSENANHGPAAPSDLDLWLQMEHPNYTQVLDPGNAAFGPFFGSAGIPWNGNFDARSMEVLSSVTGAPSSDGQTVTSDDIRGEVQPWLDWYDSHPAATYQ